MRTVLKEEGYPLALFDTYMAMIMGSIGSNQYRHLFVATQEGLVDVIDDGDLACAYYASSIPTLCELTQGGVHTTVDETEEDLKTSGWMRLSTLRRGAIVIWGAKLCTDRKLHRHIGFFVGNDQAISNRPETRSPQRHHFTFGILDGVPVRKIEAIYFHSRLGMKG